MKKKIVSKKKRSLTVKTTGKMGGQSTLKKHGKSHFSAIAKKRWEKVKSNSKK